MSRMDHDRETYHGDICPTCTRPIPTLGWLVRCPGCDQWVCDRCGIERDGTAWCVKCGEELSAICNTDSATE